VPSVSATKFLLVVNAKTEYRIHSKERQEGREKSFTNHLSALVTFFLNNDNNNIVIAMIGTMMDKMIFMEQRSFSSEKDINIYDSCLSIRININIAKYLRSNGSPDSTQRMEMFHSVDISLCCVKKNASNDT